jgi:RNA polymerase primary sigma factor
MDPTLTRYFADIRERPPLSREEEAVLAKTIKRRKGGKSPNDLVECNLGFVVTIAAEYRGLGIPFEDLINEGNLGLIEAAHRYDPARGVRFITYAVWWIRKAILKSVADHSSVVRVPTYRRKKMRLVRDAEQALRGKLGRAPNRAEIAEQLSGAVAHLDHLLNTNPREISLDDPCAPDADRVVRDVIADGSSVSPENRFLRDEDSSLVRRAMSVLTDKERRVIRERYGLSGFRPMTLNEIGQRMDISRERVRQIEVQAKQKIRRSIDRWKRVDSPSKEAKVENKKSCLGEI